MVALVKERLIPLADVAEIFPGHPSLPTIHRWARIGVAGHKLETLRSGGRILTSREAVERLWAKLNPELQGAAV